MSERQLRSAEKVHGDTLRLPSEKPQQSAYDLFEESLHLGITGSVATLRLPRGRFPPGMLSLNSLRRFLLAGGPL